MFLVFYFEREIIREQLSIVRNIVGRQEFLNNYIIHLNQSLESFFFFQHNMKLQILFKCRVGKPVAMKTILVALSHFIL